MTIRAAARGALDFTKADIRSSAWWRLVGAIARAVDTEDTLRGATASLTYRCAIASDGSLDDTSANSARRAAAAQLNTLLDVLWPWDAQADRPAAVRASLVDDYKRIVGDPADPAFRAKMEEDRRRHEEEKRRRSQAPVETDDERISRLQQEQRIRQQRRQHHRQRDTRAR